MLGDETWKWESIQSWRESDKDINPFTHSLSHYGSNTDFAQRAEDMDQKVEAGKTDKH